MHDSTTARSPTDFGKRETTVPPRAYPRHIGRLLIVSRATGAAGNGNALDVKHPGGSARRGRSEGDEMTLVSGRGRRRSLPPVRVPWDTSRRGRRRSTVTRGTVRLADDPAASRGRSDGDGLAGADRRSVPPDRDRRTTPGARARDHRDGGDRSRSRAGLGLRGGPCP